MIILALTLLLFQVLISDANQFRYDYKYYEEADGWLKMHKIPANWQEARLRCKLEGGNLASPVTAELRDAMLSMMKSHNVTDELYGSVYTGIHATLSAGDYQTIEGMPLEKIPIKWAPNEPNNNDNKDNCITFDENGSIIDVNCNELYPYMCFKKNSGNVTNGSCGTIDPAYNYEPKTGKCYKFHRNGVTWSRAHMTCTAEGAHLAIINSETEREVLGKLFVKNPANVINSRTPDYAIIGFKDWGEHGSWWTVHGETLEEAGFARWGPGQPDSHGEVKFCGAITRDALLDDVMCESRLAFICEKSPNSLKHTVYF